MRLLINLVDRESQEEVQQLNNAWVRLVTNAIKDELDNRGVEVAEDISFENEALMMLMPYHGALALLVGKVLVIDFGVTNVIAISANDMTARVDEVLEECDVDGNFPSAFRMTVNDVDFDSREFFEIGRCRKLTRQLEVLLREFILHNYHRVVKRTEQLIINFNW